jgi:hypothetical protein
VDTTPPDISDPRRVALDDDESYLLEWHPFDLMPDSYELLKNGTLIQSGDWNGSSISYNVIELSPGSYNITLVVFDTSGNWAAGTYFVIIEETVPSASTTSTTSPTEPPVEPTGMTIIVMVIGIAADTSVIVTLIVLRMKKG